MTVWIAPDCPPDVERHVREEARRNGEQVLPRMLRPLTQDQRVVMERQWSESKRAPKPQKPCNHGLFDGESTCQLDLIEMFHEPTNGDDE